MKPKGFTYYTKEVVKILMKKKLDALIDQEVIVSETAIKKDMKGILQPSGDNDGYYKLLRGDVGNFYFHNSIVKQIIGNQIFLKGE